MSAFAESGRLRVKTRVTGRKAAIDVTDLKKRKIAWLPSEPKGIQLNRIEGTESKCSGGIGGSGPPLPKFSH